MVERLSLPPFGMLKAFEAFGRTGGVRKAAQTLGVSHAIISRHLRGLEEWMGISLINRDTGVLTPRGYAYHQEITAALRAIERATDELCVSTDRSLKINSVPGFACNWLVCQLSAFRRACPDIDLLIRPKTSPSDFDQEDVHADILYLGPSERVNLPSRLRAMEICRPQVFPVANASLAQEINARIHKPDDLLHEPLIEEDNDMEWVTWFKAQSVSISSITPFARLWHATLALAAAKDGQGLAMTNIYLTGADLLSGSLAQVHLPHAPWSDVTIGTYALVAPVANWQNGRLIRFGNWLATQALSFRSTIALSHVA